MPSLAHEGNPKTDSITIEGGQVLSEAVLEINFEFFGGGNPNVPDDNTGFVPGAACAYTEESRVIGTCPLGLRIIDRYDLGSYAGNRLNGTFIGCSGTPSGGFVFQPSSSFAIDVLSGRQDLSSETQGHFAGFSMVEGVINPSHLGDFLSVFAVYNEVVGAPVSGFCFWVDIDSTPCDFTGVVAINDTPNSRSYLGYFVHADLHSDPPTIVAVGTVCPSNETFNAFSDVSSGAFELSKTSGLLLSASLSAVVPAVIDNEPNWGIIWLPNNTAGVHQATYADAATGWDIS